MLNLWESLKNSGYIRDVLPCAQPWVPLHASSRIAALGKTPSFIDPNGYGYGIKDWSSYEATKEDIEKWASNKDYGICIQTRLIRGIDIDVADPIKSLSIFDSICDFLGYTVLSYRYRENTGKMLVPVIVEGMFRKHVVRFEEGIIEFLGNGQQFVAQGTHPDSMKPYLWHHSYDNPWIFPSLLEDQYIELINDLSIRYGGFSAKLYGGVKLIGVKGETEHRDDPVVTHLYENGYVLEDDNQKLYVRCPWESDHTSENITSTAYMCAGHNGMDGSFKCLHAHCEDKNTYEFLEAVGFNSLNLLPVGDEVPYTVEQREEIIQNENIVQFNYKMRMTKDGEYKDDMATVANFLGALNCPIKIKYDEFSADIHIALTDDKEFRRLTDADLVSLRSELQNLHNFVSVNKGNANDAVLSVAKSRTYDSAISWLESLRWDGVKRIDTFCHAYMGCKEGEYAKIIGRYFFTALAGRVMNGGCMVRIVPIFIGPQGDGKSSTLRALVPVSSMYASISMNSSDEDLARNLRGVLIAEWEEVRGMSNRDSNSLKAYISKQEDKWVPKYKEFSDTYKRRFVMVGTNNPGRFLSDPTGHTRFAPIKVLSPTRYTEISAIRDQLWAEALVMYKSEGITYKALENHLLTNPSIYDEYVVVDPWENRVRGYLVNNPEADNDDIFQNCLGKTIESCRDYDTRRLENIKTRIKAGTR